MLRRLILAKKFAHALTIAFWACSSPNLVFVFPIDQAEVSAVGSDYDKCVYFPLLCAPHVAMARRNSHDTYSGDMERRVDIGDSSNV